jgi:hypothetical protein
MIGLRCSSSRRCWSGRGGRRDYSFCLCGAALNVFLPLYVVILGTAILTLAATLSHIDPVVVARSVRSGTPARLGAAA